MFDELRKRHSDVRVESWSRQYPGNVYKGFQPKRSDQKESSSVYFRLSWRNPLSWLRTGFRNRGRKFILIGVTPFQFPIYFFILLSGSALINRRSILIAHNVTPHESSIVDRALTKFLFRHLGIVITHSEHEHEAARLFTSRVERCSLPFHANLERTDAPRYGCTRSLLFVGFVREYKGLDLLIEALTMTPSDISLVIAGEFWEPLERYSSLCALHQVETRVTFSEGFVEDDVLAELLDQADALILPYRSATSTQLPKLARSRGVPSIVTPVGGLPETISPGLNGLVAPGASPKDLAQTIGKLYDDDLLAILRKGCKPPNETDEWDAYLSTFI
jgi:glycosyltransferase involved in cell wall biosynthesis